MSDDMNDDMSDDKKTELNDENSHDVHKIYSILKQQMSAPQLTEKDLKNATTDRNSKAIFISNSVKEAYEKLQLKTIEGKTRTTKINKNDIGAFQFVSPTKPCASIPVFA